MQCCMEYHFFHPLLFLGLGGLGVEGFGGFDGFPLTVLGGGGGGGEGFFAMILCYEFYSS